MKAEHNKLDSLQGLNRALRLLSSCNRVLFHATDEQTLLSDVCRLIVETGGYKMAWVGLAQHDKDKTILPVAAHGLAEDYLQTAMLTWSDTEKGRGPTGTAIRTGAAQVNHDFRANPLLAPWRDTALKFGFESSVALPLADNGSVLGALSIYSKQVNAFNHEEVNLLEELANDIAFGIATLRSRAESERLRAEVRQTAAALKDSREQYRQFVELSNEGVWSLDAEYRTNFINPAVCRMLGYAPEEMLGRPLSEFVQEDEQDKLRKELQARRDGTDPRNVIERRFRRKDGSICWGLVHATWIRDAQGKVQGGFAMVSDITERKQIEEALRESEERMRLEIARMPIGYIILDREFRVLSWNPVAEKIFGYSQEEAKGKHPYELIVPAAAQPAVSQVLSRLLSGDLSAHSENENITKDGRTIICEWTNTPLLQPDGQVQGVMSMVQDITERKKMEQALEESQATFQMLVDSSPAAICILHGERFLFANPAMEEISGYTREELLQSSVASLTHPDSLSAVRNYIQARQKGIDAPRRYEFKLLTKQGKVRWIDISATRVTYEGKPCSLGSLLDVTERKKAEERIKASEERFQTLFDRASEGIVIVSTQGKLIAANQAFARIHGYTVKEMMSMSLKDLDTPESSALIAERMKRLMEEGSLTFEVENYRKDGSTFPMEVNASMINVGGEMLVQSFCRDITERRRAEEALKLASLVFENAGEGVVVTDENNLIVAVNPAFTEITGYTFDEVKGKNPRMFASGRHDQAFYRAMWDGIMNSGYWQGEVWDRNKNGEIHAKHLTISVVPNKNGGTHRYVALFTDITQKKKSEEVIWRQANFDALTALPNRQMFQDRLEQEAKKSHRSGKPMALLLIDLDRFKEVNDSLGHHKGDQLLVDAAQRIGNCVRESDTVARLGGDEFVVILSELGEMDNIDRIADDLNSALAVPFKLGANEVYISASIGISLYPSDTNKLDDLLKNADQAMYSAKNAGRNRYGYFTPDMQLAAQKRLRIAGDLRTALAQNQFRLQYQPIVELATGHIHKAEALIRWLHPEKGMISPLDFIPLAEDTGLIVPIGEWVFREAVQQAKKWVAAYNPSFEVSVNKSPVQVRHSSNSSTSWPDYLRQQGVPGSAIAVEITEGLLLDAEANINEKLQAFHEAGMRISIDDFGTGYSSLSYLRQFNIDYLKIDRSFILGMEDNRENQVLCEAIIMMAHKLGMKVIAEGVENLAQRDLLLASGCDYAQGYLFAKPLPPEEFEKMLQRQ